MKEGNKNMIVFDSAYTYQMMVERKVSVIVTARDLDGYFDHVWTVHPVASLLYEKNEKYGVAKLYDLNERHTLIEGTIGRYKWLSWFPILNFLLSQLQLYFLVSKIVRNNAIQFIRAEDPYYNGFLAYLFSRFTKKPLFIGVWGNPGAVRKYTGKPLMKRLFKWVFVEEFVEKFILRRATCVMVQNEDNRNFVIDKGIERSRTAIFRVGNVIDPNHFKEIGQRDSGISDLLEFGLKKDENILICISRLEKLKLTDHVIKAIAILKNRNIECKLLFVGDGSFKEEMNDLVLKLGLGNNVIFCGNRSQEWLVRVVPEVSVVVSPLTGRALAEAALAEVPIVAYNIDWHGEVIETGITGELVEYLNFEEMANSIERILSDKAYAKKLGKNVRIRMMEIMDKEQNNKTQQSTYEMFQRFKIRTF